MDSDIKSIKESNEVIRRRLDDIFGERDQTCRECQGPTDETEFKILSNRVSELEERDRKRSDELSAMKREIMDLEQTLQRITFIVNSSKDRSDENTTEYKGAIDGSSDKANEQGESIKYTMQESTDVGVKQDKDGTYRLDIDTESLQHDSRNENSIIKDESKSVGLNTIEHGKIQTIDKETVEDQVEDPVGTRLNQSDKEEIQSDDLGTHGETEAIDKELMEKSNRRQVLKPNFQKKNKDRNKLRDYREPSVKHESTKQSVPVEAWWAICKQEEKAASKTEVKYLDGVQTILCIDISESIIESWIEVQTFVYDYLDGLEKLITEENFNEENVALATFGRETIVKVRLTKELSKVRTAFDDIILGGPTPLFGGILMAVAAAQSSASECHVNGAEIHKRVVLLTDGNFTEAEVFQGPDEPDEMKRDETFAQIAGILERFPQSGKELICVPVGNANVEILDQLQAIACGKRFSHTEGGKLARRFYLTKKAPIGLGFGGIPGIGLDFRKLIGLSGLGGLSGLSDMGGLGNMAEFTRNIQMHDTSSLSSKDQEHIKEIVEDHKTLTIESMSRKGASAKEKEYEESDSDVLPKIGSRVRRGPDWSWMNQDSGGPGTVIGHDESDRQVWVDWDADGHTNIYHYGGSGRYDVLLVDEPRVIRDSENIKVGCLVQPGEAWRYNFQRVKQHEKGTVIRTFGSNRVQVKWSGGYRGDYYFNRDGPSEVKLVIQTEGNTNRHRQEKETLSKSKKKNKNKNAIP